VRRALVEKEHEKLSVVERQLKVPQKRQLEMPVLN